MMRNTKDAYSRLKIPKKLYRFQLLKLGEHDKVYPAILHSADFELYTSAYIDKSFRDVYSEIYKKDIALKFSLAVHVLEITAIVVLFALLRA